MVLARLLKAYRRHGFVARTGLNPLYFNDPDSPFTHFQYASGESVPVGGGLAPQEIHFIECLCEGGYRPRNVLIIGNAFGWSALALGLILPEARIVAIDAGIEGSATDIGATLTRTIAAEEHVSVRVVTAWSPKDVASVVASACDGEPLDLVLVDGLHTNEQLARDFMGVLPHASSTCVFVFHDVLHWHMLDAFNGLQLPSSYERRVLARCPSGMGVIFPSGIDDVAKDAIDAFSDETVDLAAFLASVHADQQHPGPELSQRLSRGWRMRRFGMAHSYEMEGQLELAREQVLLAATEGANDRDVLFEVAAHHMKGERWAEAERYLKAMRALAPEWDRPAYDLGCVMKRLDRVDEARGQFADAANLNSTWAAPLYELGVLEYHQGDDAAASVHLQRVLQLEPSWAAPCHVLGLALARRDGVTSAIPWYERSIELNPDNPHVQYDLGCAHLENGEPARAAISLERATLIDPTWAPPHYIMGLVRLCLGGDVEAIPWLERAVALAPDWDEPRYELGQCMRRLARWPEAAVHFTRVLERGWPDKALWYEVGTWQRAAGNLREALDAFEHVRQNTPEWLAPHKDVGMCLRMLNRLAEAAAVLQHAVTIEPEWAGAHFELGLTYLADHDDARAAVHFQRAVNLRPGWEAPRGALAALDHTAQASDRAARLP
ncbi:MAG: tetratricopeptide repeat protein [Vicinamibacterales bacterium]